MFGIGWTEMLLIGVVALIVIGPKDLPVVMNRLGKAVSAIRKMGSEFQREINKATGLDTVTDLRKSITEPLKQTAAQIRDEFNKPLQSGGVAPSGVIKPKNPKVESVVDEIHEKVGMNPPPSMAPAPQPYTPFTKEAQEKYRAEQAGTATPPVEPAKPAKPARAKKAKPVESPAPVEAIAPAVKKPRVRKAVVAAAEAPPDMFATEPAPGVKKPAAPRRPRAAKPKSDA